MRKDFLFIATLGYLLLPNVIFVLGWLKPGLAAVVTAAVIAGFARAAARSGSHAEPISAREWAFIVALAAFWTWAAGIGELNVQTGDYFKHNLVFRDLVVRRWPVTYAAAERGDPLLCYYLAYYLPPGLFGKIAGLQHTAAASLAWGGLGVGLAFAWVCRLGRPHGTPVLAAFTLIDGLGWLPRLMPVVRGALGGAGAWVPIAASVNGRPGPAHDLAFGPARLMFHCEPANLAWTPQHALAAWLATALVLRLLREEGTGRDVTLPWASVLLWSPFAAVGVLPFAARAVLRAPRRLPHWADLAAGSALALPVGFYLLSHVPLQYVGFYVSGLPTVWDWLRYASFLLKSVGIVWLAAALVRRRYAAPDDASWQLLCLAAVTLVATTLVYVGRYNDWVMRESMPSLFVFRVILAIAAVKLWTHPAKPGHRVAFSVLLILSTERSLRHYILLPMGKLPGQVTTTTISTADRHAGSLALLPRSDEFDFAGQYMGARRSFFGLYLMKATASPAVTLPGGT